MDTKKIIQNIIELRLDKKDIEKLQKNDLQNINILFEQQTELVKLINSFIDFLKDVESEFYIMNNLLESSSLNIVNLSEELINMSYEIENSKLSQKIQDKTFQIISSLEFQDIISQKINKIKEFNDLIINQYNKFIEKYKISNNKLKKVCKEKEEQKIQEKEKEILTDQNLVDQLLAEFGIKQ